MTTKTKKTDASGAAMNARNKETDPAFDRDALEAAAEAWEAGAAKGHLRIAHVQGPYLMGEQEHPGEVWVRDIDMKDTVVLVIVGANVVDVHGLPPGYRWETVDHDLLKENPDDDKRDHGFERLESAPRSKPRPSITASPPCICPVDARGFVDIRADCRAYIHGWPAPREGSR